MKYSPLFLIGFGILRNLTAQDEQEQPLRFKAPTESEIQANQRTLVERQKDLPIERREVAYMMTSDGAITPGFVDPVSSSFYRWKDVVLQSSEVPNLADGTVSGSFLIQL